MRLSLRETVQYALHAKGAERGYELVEDGPTVIVYYPDAEQPEHSQDDQGVYRMAGDRRLSACRELLKEVPSLAVAQEQYQGRYALRVRDKLQA